ncbi:MAG: 50S ribosomal protein L19 [Armatimonadetes bacterium]|nr:50S ribosomal protein L19 [Armatimonadota bacterium]
MDLIRMIEKEQMKSDIPEFGPGDTVKAFIKVIEGGKERIQAFEGVCIVRSNSGLKESVTLRKVSHGIGVERTLLLHSPRLEKLEVVRRGQVRRARLYYLRERIGKKARVKEKKTALPGGGTR